MFKTDAIWTIAASLFAGLAQIITLSYLSHQIPLAALGALAMMNVCIYFATSLQDFGISSFQVQLTDSSPADHTVLLVLNMLQALLVVTLLYVASPLIVSFYQMPQLASLLVGCCVLVFINGLYAVHQASLIKQLQLVSLAKVELISKVAGVGVTWYLILQQPTDLNAIIIGYICSALLKTLMLWLLKNDALKFATPVNLQLAGQAFRYGCWQFGSQQLSLIRAQSDQLIVGKILGMEVLGIYSLAREIIQYPARFTQPILQRLLLPRFANRTGDTVGDTVGDKKQLLYKSLQYSLWFNCFIYSMLALCSGLLVQILFPAQYAQVAVILCLLALGAVVRPNGQILVPYVQATGQVRRELVWNLVATFIWCGALLLTFMFFDILVGAVIISMLQILLSYSAFWYLTKQDLLPALKIICNMSFKPLAAALVCSLAGLGIVNLWF